MSIEKQYIKKILNEAAQEWIAQAVVPSTGYKGKYIFLKLLGSDGVFRIDGRLSLQNALEKAKNRFFVSFEKIHPEILGFSITRSSDFSRALDELENAFIYDKNLHRTPWKLGDDLPEELRPAKKSNKTYVVLTLLDKGNGHFERMNNKVFMRLEPAKAYLEELTDELAGIDNIEPGISVVLAYKNDGSPEIYDINTDEEIELVNPTKESIDIKHGFHDDPANPGIRMYEPDEEEYKRLEEVAKEVSEKSPIKLTVGETWFDFGQRWRWTTLIAHNPAEDPKSILSSWQAIDPEQQRRIIQGMGQEVAEELIKEYNEEYNEEYKNEANQEQWEETFAETDEKDRMLQCDFEEIEGVHPEGSVSITKEVDGYFIQSILRQDELIESKLPQKQKALEALKDICMTFDIPFPTKENLEYLENGTTIDEKCTTEKKQCKKFKNEDIIHLSGTGKVKAVLKKPDGEEITEVVEAYLKGTTHGSYDNNIFGVEPQLAVGGYEYETDDADVDFEKSEISDEDAERLGDYYPIVDILEYIDVEWEMDDAEPEDTSDDDYDAWRDSQLEKEPKNEDHQTVAEAIDKYGKDACKNMLDPIFNAEYNSFDTTPADLLDGETDETEEILRNTLPGDPKEYDDAIVFNVKNMGFPSYGDVVEAIAAKTGDSMDQVRADYTENDMMNGWVAQQELFSSQLQDEYGSDFRWTGRSGGYIGLKNTDKTFEYNMEGIQKAIEATDPQKFLIDEVETELEAILEDKGEITSEDVKLAFESNIDFDQLMSILAEDVSLFSLLKVSDSFKEEFTQLYNEVVDTAAEWEKPDMWVEQFTK